MSSSPNALQYSSGQWLVSFVLVIVVMVVVAIAFGNFYSWRNVALKGQSHGFRIGMSKKEVLDQYKALNKDVNLRTVGSTNAHIVLDASELILTPEFESSDHWMGYRDSWPLYYQDLFFLNDKLTNITTHFRFFEIP